MMPAVRRIDDVVVGAPLEVAGRVLVPRARRSGWVVVAGPWALFRLGLRPVSLEVRDGEPGAPRVVPVRDRTRAVAVAVTLVVLVLASVVRRRSR